MARVYVRASTRAKAHTRASKAVSYLKIKKGLRKLFRAESTQLYSVNRAIDSKRLATHIFKKKAADRRLSSRLARY